MAKLDKRARYKRRAERTARELAIARSKPAQLTGEERKWRPRPLRWEHAGDAGAAAHAVVVVREIDADAIASAAPPGWAVFSTHTPDAMGNMDLDALKDFERVVLWPTYSGIGAANVAPEWIRETLANPDALPSALS